MEILAIKHNRLKRKHLLSGQAGNSLGMESRLSHISALRKALLQKAGRRLLALAVLAQLFSLTAWADETGRCGDNLTWTYVDATKTLIISGSGQMEEYIYYDDYSNFAETPWESLCLSMQTLIIESGVTSIGGGAFYNCRGLISITIPNTITSVGKSAFYDCSGLTSVTIPNSVTSIGDYAFYDCSGLTSIVVSDGNPTYDSRDNCNAIIETSSNVLVVGCMNTKISNSVTSIGNNAFCGCRSLTSINIPNSVTSIGERVFSGCSGLTSITIPNSVTSIGEYNQEIKGVTNVEVITVSA